MAQMTAVQATEKVERQAEKVRSDSPRAWPEAASFGDSHRQGDIYITLLDKLPDGVVPDPSPTTRLDAPDNHEGHTLDSLDGVRVYRLMEPGMCDGPIIVLTETRRVVHSRHGHLGDVCPGVYAISYQQNLDALERAVRAQD